MLVEKTINAVVYADKDKIREVLFNLIGNALKFTPENGTITISFNEHGGMIETTVNDTGKGISKEDISRLFTKFGRLENTLTSVAETEGTGLGLYICKQFIELSGGKIWAISEVGKGATFIFSLPAHHIKAVNTSTSTQIPPTALPTPTP